MKVGRSEKHGLFVLASCVAHNRDLMRDKEEAVRKSMAPAQDPLAIATQTMLQCPYVTEGTVTIKLSRWYGKFVGDVEKVEQRRNNGIV